MPGIVQFKAGPIAVLVFFTIAFLIYASTSHRRDIHKFKSDYNYHDLSGQKESLIKVPPPYEPKSFDWPGEPEFNRPVALHPNKPGKPPKARPTTKIADAPTTEMTRIAEIVEESEERTKVVAGKQQDVTTKKAKPTRPAAAQLEDSHTTSSDSSSSSGWNYSRDAHNLHLTEQQCDDFFPRLYADLDRAVAARGSSTIKVEELDDIEMRKGMVRAMIYNQQLYVIEAKGEIESRTRAALLAIHRALISSHSDMPNLEFVLSVEDSSIAAAHWALARNENDDKTWLMPDFAYWSSPEAKIGSYAEVQSKALEMEDSSRNPSGQAWDWQSKQQKVFWRGSIKGDDLKIRERLLSATESKTWADVKAVDLDTSKTTQKNFKTPAEHCQYKYLVNTAGNAYSGRLKSIQNCRSVVISNDMQWITHHTHLMKDNGRDQNYVKVNRDWSDLEEKVELLVDDDKMAEKIAENSVRLFRERYLTPAAEVCYWRRLFRTWRTVSFEPKFYKTVNGIKQWRGIPIESFVLQR